MYICQTYFKTNKPIRIIFPSCIVVVRMKISLAYVTFRLPVIGYPSFNLNWIFFFHFWIPPKKDKTRFFCKIHLIPLYSGKPKSTRAERA